MMLEVRDLGMVFPGGVTALDGVDLQVAAGEFVAVAGPSGCGKSTLLGLLAGLLEPSRGEILLEGRRPAALLGRAAYMPQNHCLMPWRTVLDNCTVGLELRGMPRSAARDRARAELERFGLTGFAHRRPADLSGGMRQRAALLRTFLAERDIMLLDEPFASLDALTRRGMQDWLLDVAAQARTTIVLVTHDVAEAAYLADRVYVLSARPGRVVLEEPVRLPRPRRPELLATPEFAALQQRLLAPLLPSGR
jgi:ABC-type nitrate/sulfonate/bicarbonate transport system ATPase subunit